MTLLELTPTGTVPGVVDATATAVSVALDSAGFKQSVALARSGLVLPAGPEVTGLV